MAHFRNLKAPVLLLVVAMIGVGCSAPGDRLSFPAAPAERSDTAIGYDTNGSGRVDFALLADEAGRFDVLAYDDNGDGLFDRQYRLSEYDLDDLPHVVIMLDSVPFRTLADWHARGNLPWFGPPSRVVPPVPNLSEVIFAQILQAAPHPGMTQVFYDPRIGKSQNFITQMALGRSLPMQRLVDYHATHMETGKSFFDASDWYAVELARVKQAVDDNPGRETLVYLSSSASVVCLHSEAGAVEILEGLQQLCMQLLYERRGAIRISVLSDHGHTYVPPQPVDMAAMVRDAGFHPSKSLRNPNDVVIDSGGLVSYVGMHTRAPDRLAAELVKRAEVEFVAYQQGERVMLVSAAGSAAIERRGGRYRYLALQGDPLDYAAVVGALKNHADKAGFVAPDAWLHATIDHHYPDAPFRLWQAFHELVVNPPSVMVVLREQYGADIGMLGWFVDMQSTHGGLDGKSSMAFVMTMGRELPDPMRSADVMNALMPDYRPMLRE